MNYILVKRMKKIKLSYIIIAILAVIVLTSSVSWSAPGFNTRKCYAEVVTLEGHKYVMATTGASNSPGICIIHAASCNCNKH